MSKLLLAIVDTSALPEAFVKSTDLISAFSLFDDDLGEFTPETACENWHVCDSLLVFSSLLISPWNDDQLQAAVSIGCLFGPLRVAMIVGLASLLPPDLWDEGYEERHEVDKDVDGIDRIVS
jgi:hypothetical protein